MAQAKWRNYTKEQLQEIANGCYSYREFAIKLGYSPNGGGSIDSIKQAIEYYNLNINHFTGQGWNGHSNHQTYSKEKYSLEEIFIQNSPVTQKVLRGYVERHNIIPYQCQKCNCNGIWQDGIISLEIDHINGNNTDNRIENLRYLCPNCHALTDTYRGKNKALKNKMEQ